MQKFTYIIEKDEGGYYIADVLELPGCHTQAPSLDLLEERIREAITRYLKEQPPLRMKPQFVGVHQVEVVLS